MKNLVLYIFIFVVAGGNSFAQEKNQESRLFQNLDQNIQSTAGYVFNSDYNALKATIAYNNLLFHSVGFYTSFEKGLDSDYFSEIWGATVSIYKGVSFFAGVDLYTKYGLFNNNSPEGVRKEIGFGYEKNHFCTKAGWSYSVGFSLEVGYCWFIPLKEAKILPEK